MTCGKRTSVTKGARNERQRMKLGRQPSKWLVKKSKVGFRGYPMGTVAFYGPDDRRASKVAVAVFTAPDTEPAELRRWFADSGDIRKDLATSEEISLFLQSHGSALGRDDPDNSRLSA
jgi:hypothetical protein